MESIIANTHDYFELFQAFLLELPFSRHVSFSCYEIFIALDVNFLTVFSLCQDNLPAIETKNSNLLVV